jgi:hypothetical protein
MSNGCWCTGTTYVTTRKGQSPTGFPGICWEMGPLVPDKWMLFLFLTKGEGLQTKVNITIFSCYDDLCVHNFSLGMSSPRFLIGRLQGPQGEMTEQAREE